MHTHQGDFIVHMAVINGLNTIGELNLLPWLNRKIGFPFEEEPIFNAL